MKTLDAYKRLRDLIKDGMNPGTPLSEPELSRILGISRTPIRHALAMLEKDGLVKIVPKRGAFVSTLGVVDIHELFEIREALEVYAIGGAARRINLAALSKNEESMDLIYSAMAGDVSPTEKYKALEAVFIELHRLILAAHGNDRLAELMESLSGTWTLGRKMLMRRIRDEQVNESYEEHKRIISALKSRHSDAAKRRMREHLVNSRMRYLLALNA